MTESHALVLAAIALYLAECFHWYQGPVAVLRVAVKGSFRVVRASPLLNRKTSALVLADPFPPLGPLLAAQDWPLAVSPQLVASMWDDTSVQMPLADRKGDEERVSVVLTALIGSVSCEHVSSHWAGVLRGLATQPPGMRTGRILDEIRGRLDAAEVRRRISCLRNESRTLTFSCNALFYYVFVALPVILFWLGLTSVWPPVLGGLLIGMAGITLLAWRLCRRSGAGWLGLLPTLLTPLGAIRAADHFWRHAVCTYHPLALVNALCAHDDVRMFGSWYLRQLRYPPPVEGRPSEASEARAWFTQHALAACEEALRRAGHDISDLLRPPAPESADAAAYCPRCLQQYSAEPAVCNDCGGVPLKLFRDGPLPVEPDIQLSGPA